MDNYIEKFKLQRILSRITEREQAFARMLCEKPGLSVKCSKLAETAYTDGESIVLAPEINDIYLKEELLLNVCGKLNIPPEFAKPDIALSTLAHGLNIHECLHILYPSFRERYCIAQSIDSAFRKNLFRYFSNIFEDVYIERRGSREFNNFSFFLSYFRQCLGSSTELGNVSDLSAVPYFLMAHYFGFEAGAAPNKNVSEYLEKIIPLGDAAVAEDCPEKRLMYSVEIINLLEPLYKDIEQKQNEIEKLLGELVGIFNQITGGSSSQNIKYDQKSDQKSSGERSKSGANPEKNGEKEGGNGKEAGRGEFPSSGSSVEQQAREFLEKLSVEEKSANAKISQRDRDHTGYKSIEVIRPEITSKELDEYKRAVIGNRKAISEMAKKFSELDFSEDWELEPKKQFGVKINSKRMADKKKRYWYSRVPAAKGTELAVAVLIDASGSMSCVLDETKAIAMILHEALEQNGIENCIAFHNFFWTTNIYEAVSFGGRENDKYGIFSTKAGGTSNETAALEWAAGKLLKKTAASRKLIISISDGYPNDVDTAADYVRFLKKKRINTAAIALNDSYEQLSRMYPRCAVCNDISELPKKLTAEIRREMKIIR